MMPPPGVGARVRARARARVRVGVRCFALFLRFLITPGSNESFFPLNDHHVRVRVNRW